MEEIYGFRSTSTSPENYLISASSVDHYWPFTDNSLSVAASVITDIETNPNQIVLPKRQINRQFHQAKPNGVDAGDDDNDDASGDSIKAKIVSHPSYFKLLKAYIDCQKVGASQEVAYLLDDIRHENDVREREAACLGADPELDVFMESFYHLLVKYKSEVTRPFDEAMVFLGNIETQLRTLAMDEGAVLSQEEEEEVISRGETADGTQKLKDKLLRKFGGRGISTLKQEFTKRKKKGKLPKEATTLLLDWWHSHYTWPYPTEGDKISLAETTGLDPKQINNWFINQRKRHWNPSESMQLAIMGGLPGHYISDD